MNLDTTTACTICRARPQRSPQRPDQLRASRHHEVADTDTKIGIIGPNDTDSSLWDDDLPAEGRHALIIGDPSASAYAIIGNRDELAIFAQRLAAVAHGGTITERGLTLWIPTESLWRDLEAALDLAPYELGRFKQWAAMYPKHLRGTYDLDIAISWARRNGIPFEEQTTVRHRGSLGVIDAEGNLQLH